jgi:hypothetical protein
MTRGGGQITGCWGPNTATLDIGHREEDWGALQARQRILAEEALKGRVAVPRPVVAEAGAVVLPARMLEGVAAGGAGHTRGAEGLVAVLGLQGGSGIGQGEGGAQGLGEEVLLGAGRVGAGNAKGNLTARDLGTRPRGGGVNRSFLCAVSLAHTRV